MKLFKRSLSILIVFAMMMQLCACGTEDSGTPITELFADIDETTYMAESDEIYETQLSSFRNAYEKALSATNDVSLRYAYMAIAEAKLLESAVFCPTYAYGGGVELTRIAPYTIGNSKWGLEQYDYSKAVVVKNDIISSEMYSELKNMFSELRGSGEYTKAAKEYLTSKGYELSDTLGLVYSTELTTWDISATYLTGTYKAYLNTTDMLLKYDNEGIQQPALAKDYKVSDDGLTYTFYLKNDAVWTDYQGRKIGNVVADDFVAGLQHALDAKGGAEYLAGTAGAGILNADKYISGEITDFNEVGVRAVDKYTLEYTLEKENPFFNTILSMAIMLPLSREYYISQGGKFGTEFDSSVESYLYGKDPEHIAYCGPYTVESYIPENSITFKKNDSYWNKEEIGISTINWTFTDGSDATAKYKLFCDGINDEDNMSSEEIDVVKNDGLYDEYTVLVEPTAAMYGIFFNLNRKAFANINDESTMVTTKTVENAEMAKKALSNVHFRRALMFAIDRASYNAQSVGEELKYTSLLNSYIPGNFVLLPDDVTIDMNGESKSFAAGTYYGEMVQSQLDADGFTAKVWDRTENDELGSSFGFDGWYSPENAMKELETAIAELGIEVSEDKPIYIDIPTHTGSVAHYNKAAVIKQSIEKALSGKVVVNLVEGESTDEWYYAGYYTTRGYECNYDIYDVSGWSPDYGDPQTYLGAFYGVSGDLTTHLGLY